MSYSQKQQEVKRVDNPELAAWYYEVPTGVDVVVPIPDGYARLLISWAKLEDSLKRHQAVSREKARRIKERAAKKARTPVK